MNSSILTFQLVAQLETARSARNGRGFSLLRVAPVGWAALDHEMDALAGLVSAHVRRTDFVQRLREREVAVVLIEAVGDQVLSPVTRLQEAARKHLPKLEILVGHASVRPGQKWQEGWRWAGQLLVADAAAPAAA